jgi:hypothetical protein
MSQLGLLALGRSFAGGRKKAQPFRVDRRALPRFNAAPASSPPKDRVARTGAATSPFSGAPAAPPISPDRPQRHPAGRAPVLPSQPEAAPKLAPARSRRAGDSFWRRRKSRREPLAGETAEALSLSAVRVVRNDLRDADVEVLTPPLGKGSLRLGLAKWRKWMGAWRRLGR